MVARTVLAFCLVFGLGGTARAESGLADGRYWVRRAERDPPRGSSSDGNTTTTTFRVACRQLTVATDGHRRSMTLDKFTFYVGAGKAGPVVSAPTLSNRTPPLELGGTCSEKLPAVDDGGVFTDEKSCIDAAPLLAEQHCHGHDCTFASGAPFLLPACEAELVRLGRVAARVTAASHDDALRSLIRLEHVASAGGTLWIDEPQEARCEPMVVRPAKDGTVTLSERYATKAGGHITFSSTARLEPLFHRAHEVSEFRDESPSGGGCGHGDTDEVLYLGHDVILLGAGWLYFTRQACEASR